MTPVDQLRFSQSACKHIHVEKITKSHPFQCILHKCSMTSTCSNSQYAEFNVNKMNISKNYILFPIKSTSTIPNSKKITSKKNKKKTKKLLFCVNTSLFWSTKRKDNSSLWPFKQTPFVGFKHKNSVIFEN